jgi:archaellum component FlaC
MPEVAYFTGAQKVYNKIKGIKSMQAREIVEALEKERESLKKLSRLIFSEIALDPGTRLAITSTMLSEVSTKKDLESLREYIDNRMESEIRDLREEIRHEISRVEASLNKRIDDLYGVTKASFVAIAITLQALY